MTMLNVGDTVLYTKKYGSRPVAGNVHKVTKTQAMVTLVDGTEIGPFKRESWSECHEQIGGSSRWTHGNIWPKTPKHEAELNQRADKAELEAAEKKAAQEKQQLEYAEEKARQLAEVKDACGSLDGELPPMIKKIMPDGTRLYFASIPVKKVYAECKKGWEEVIVRCKDVEDINWDQPRDPVTGERNMVIKVEAHYTYTNGDSGSFGSVSGSKFANDEEAIWNAIRDQYNRW